MELSNAVLMWSLNFGITPFYSPHINQNQRNAGGERKTQTERSVVNANHDIPSINTYLPADKPHALQNVIVATRVPL
jgi:hypothetical protein